MGMLKNDGEQWTVRDSGVGSMLQRVIGNGDEFLVAGDSGTILTVKQDTHN